MGRGKIVENLGSGQYSVQLLYGSSAQYQERIDALNSQIADLDAKIAAETDPLQKQIYELQRASLIKQRQELQSAFAEPVIDCWCVELVDDLEIDDIVATIEIPGERQQFNIRPAYTDRAAWVNSRDGQLRPAMAYDRWSSIYGQMVLPGWQKEKPNYRIGQIIAIDHGTGTCQLSIIPAFSSQQGLNVNQESGTVLGGTETHYQKTGIPDPSWDDFKTRYPSHPLVTNTADPIPLASNDELIDQIWAIDIDVNSKHIYETDASYREVGDYWDIMAGDDPNALLNDRGDCEDFALTKADKLISQLGLSPRNIQIALCYTQEGDYHANLLIPTTNHGTLVLDINLIGRKTKEQLDEISWYRWDKFLINGDDWAIDSREAYTVPIEYMNCGSSVFVVGDTVIVEFENFNWNSPKVIGFKDNPKECGVWFYRLFGNASPGYWGNTNFAVNMVSKATSFNISQSDLDWRVESCSAVLGIGILIIGGYTYWWDPNYGQWGGWQARAIDRVDYFSGGIYQQKTDLPGSGRSGIAAFEQNDKIYAIGGWDWYKETGIRSNHWTFISQSNYQFDLLLDAWAQRKSFPFDLSLARGLNINGSGYVFGSLYLIYDHDGNHLDYVIINAGGNYRYNDYGDSWESKKSMDYRQGNYGGQFSIDNAGFVFGYVCENSHPEFNPNVSPLNENFGYCPHSMQRYDEITDSWQLNKSADDFTFRFLHYNPAYGITEYLNGYISSSYGAACAGFENKGYINPSMLNTDGIVEYDPLTDSYSIFVYNDTAGPPAGALNSVPGAIAGII